MHYTDAQKPSSGRRTAKRPFFRCLHLAPSDVSWKSKLFAERKYSASSGTVVQATEPFLRIRQRIRRKGRRPRACVACRVVQKHRSTGARPKGAGHPANTLNTCYGKSEFKKPWGKLRASLAGRPAFHVHISSDVCSESYLVDDVLFFVSSAVILQVVPHGIDHSFLLRIAHWLAVEIIDRHGLDVPRHQGIE